MKTLALLLLLCAGDALAAKAVLVTGGDAHNCALLDTGKIRCWGDNGSGEAGQGDTRDRGGQPGDMAGLKDIDLGTESPAVFVEAGGSHNCAVFADGTLKCWGDNGSGQLGIGMAGNRGESPGQLGRALPFVNLGTGVKAVSATGGIGHTCILLATGAVKCFGNNSAGQLGLGDTRNRGLSAADMGGNLPAVDLGGKKAVSLSSGDNFTCALLENGQIKCWGENTGGQLGLGDTNNRGTSASQMGRNLPEVSLGTGRKALQMAAGWTHVCALLDDQSVKCWGSNGGGLGLASTNPRGTQPGQMGDSLPALELEPGLPIQKLSCGSSHCCVLFSVGTTKCWMRNDNGCLGTGDLNSIGDQPDEMGINLPFVDLGPLAVVQDIGLGWRHTCAVMSDGSVKCWGKNDDGRLGLGDTNDRGDGPLEMGDRLPMIRF